MEHIIQVPAQFIEDSDWIRFPGGVLAGKCPKTTCPTCRAAVGRASEPRAGATLCFQCYRAEIDRDRALKAAGQLDTASTRRFQTALPFEPVNRPRLEMLKVERATARASALRTGSGKFAERRRQAQIAARHALQRIAAGPAGHSVHEAAPFGKLGREREMAAAIHAAELQLPESWLPFVVSR